MNNPSKILEWYIKKVINYQDKNVARISLLNYSYDLIYRNLPDNKYLNMVFLD